MLHPSPEGLREPRVLYSAPPKALCAIACVALRLCDFTQARLLMHVNPFCFTGADGVPVALDVFPVKGI